MQSHPGCQAPTDRSEEPEKDLADVFKLHAQGRTRVARETRVRPWACSLNTSARSRLGWCSICVERVSAGGASVEDGVLLAVRAPGWPPRARHRRLGAIVRYRLISASFWSSESVASVRIAASTEDSPVSASGWERPASSRPDCARSVSADRFRALAMALRTLTEGWWSPRSSWLR